MNKLLKKTLITAAASMIIQAAAAQPGFWDHNGSLMRMVENGPMLAVYYDQVRPGLIETIPPRSPRFEGQRIGPVQLAGLAFVYTKHCPGMRFPYEVQGTIINGVIELHGPAAVVDPYSCSIVGYRPDSDNAHIIITLVRPELPPPAIVVPSVTPPPPTIAPDDPDAQAEDLIRQGREFCARYPRHRVCRGGGKK